MIVIAATFGNSEAASAAAEDIESLLHVPAERMGRGVLGAYLAPNDGHALLSARVLSDDADVARAILRTHGGVLVAQYEKDDSSVPRGSGG